MAAPTAATLLLVAKLIALTDSTHRPNRRSFSRVVFRATLTTVLLSLTAAWTSPPAFADGDPASDVLAQQSLFLPRDAGVTASQQVQMDALLQAAARDGYPIRVALIASSTDLGSVTELWNQPQTYANFLGQELALVYRRSLLVVMPHGLGVYHVSQPLRAEKSALAGQPSAARGSRFGAFAVAAIQYLAEAAGHPLPAPHLPVSTKPGPGETTSWIALATGSILIALAWIASFRARPPRLRRRNTASA